MASPRPTRYDPRSQGISPCRGHAARSGSRLCGSWPLHGLLAALLSCSPGSWRILVVLLAPSVQRVPVRLAGAPDLPSRVRCAAAQKGIESVKTNAAGATVVDQTG